MNIRRLSAVATAITLGVGTARAQGVSSPIESAKPEAETIVLSPFEVNSADDTRYRATNTLDGSRLNTALRACFELLMRARYRHSPGRSRVIGTVSWQGLLITIQPFSNN